MRVWCFCILLLALAAAGPATGLTLYKCVLLDGGGVVYQEDEPNASECHIEKKELNPDANVIPAADFIGGKKPGETTDSDSTAPAASQAGEDGTGGPATTEP